MADLVLLIMIKVVIGLLIALYWGLIIKGNKPHLLCRNIQTASMSIPSSSAGNIASGANHEESVAIEVQESHAHSEVINMDLRGDFGIKARRSLSSMRSG